MDAVALLLGLLEPLPDDATLPVRWIRERLSASAPTPEREDLVDLSCEQVAKQLGRKACTVRGWCASGVIPRAYRFNQREWRIPAASLREYLERARQQQERDPEKARSVDLGAWRRVRR